MITPTQAIRIAIMTIKRDRSYAVKANECAEALAQYDEGIAALEEAIRQLQQFEQLRAMLKVVVQ